MPLGLALLLRGYAWGNDWRTSKGVSATLSFVSRVLPDNLKFCHPNTATPEQMLQVVISFVESNPESVSQDFRLGALATMHDKWPCQE